MSVGEHHGGGPEEGGFDAAQDLTEALSNAEASENDNFNDREQLLLRESRFFEPYKEDLKGLFEALGRENRWSDDPRQMLNYIRSGWIGGEHGNREKDQKDQFTPDQTSAAMPILERMGMSGETLPPDGAQYDDLIIVGGTTPANYRRMKLVLDLIQHHGIKTKRITFLVGERPREARDGTDEEILSRTGRFEGGDMHDNPWVAQMLKAEEEMRLQANVDEDQITEPPQAFKTETDMARVATMKAVPWGESMKPHRIDLALAQPGEEVPDRVGGLPGRLVTDYRFTVPIQIGREMHEQEIVLINAAAVERMQGDPRHTTASSTSEWLERHAPEDGANVLYVTGNPHTLRTAQDTMLILKNAGRDDIHLDIAGTSPPANAQIQFYLGEVGRLIDNDVRRNYEGSSEEVEAS